MNDVVVFKDGELRLEVKVSSKEETVWLTQQQMAELFNSSRTNIIDILTIFILMKNLIEFQPVKISDKFEKKVKEM